METRFLDWIPSINAALNLTSGALIALGLYFIRHGRRRQHMWAMVGATAASAVFLAFYLTRYFLVGVTKFPGEGWVRALYFVILGSHELLAAASLPLVLLTLYRALRGQFHLHKRIARFTAPVWLYVSVTGFVIYVMLYRVYTPIH